MATSGVYTFNRTRNEIINGSLRKVGAIGQGQTAQNEEINEAAEALEILVQALGNDVFPFWAVEWKTYIIGDNASDTVLGTDGSTTYTCIRPHTSSSTDRPTTGNDYSTYWTERGSSGSAWATSTSYTAINVFEPGTEILSISKAFLRRNETDHPLDIITRDEFFSDISDKRQTGMPNVLMFEPNVTPKVWIDPIPDTTTDVLHYLAWRRLQDFDAQGNNPDARQQWIKYFIFQLAADLAPEYGLSPQREGMLESKAQALLRSARRRNKLPESSSFVSPAYGRG